MLKSVYRQQLEYSFVFSFGGLLPPLRWVPIVSMLQLIWMSIQSQAL
jgi:hypothetical protein